MLDTRAARSTGDDRIAGRVVARLVRQEVLGFYVAELASDIEGESASSRTEQEYWIRATRAEALFGLGRVDEAQAEFEAART